MAATARKRIAVCVAGLLCCCVLGRADDSADMHSAVNDIADSLSSGFSAQAMIPFSKQFPQYDRLERDFEALTGAFQVDSRVDFTDENDAADALSVTVRWALTLTTQGGQSTTRQDVLTIKFQREGKTLRIVGCEPLTIFDPATQ